MTVPPAVPLPSLPPPPPPPPRPAPGPPARRGWFRYGRPDLGRGGASVAWFALGGIFAVVTLLWGTFQVVGAVAHQERTERRTVAADGVDRLVVRSASGRVDLVVGDPGEIAIDALVRDGIVDTRFAVATIGRELRVTVGCSWLTPTWCKADLRIAVPAELAVDVRTDTGRITAVDLAGDLLLASDIGTVRATGLRSPAVDARSDAGEVRLVFASAPRLVSARSDVGRVEVAVPEGDAYRVDGRSDAGRVRIEVRTDPLAERTITAASDARGVLVRYLEPGEG